MITPMNESTGKLFDEDAYLTEFTAGVLSCETFGDGYRVVLDRTAFFPEAGGQTSDRGSLVCDGTEAQVRDVQIDEESGRIIHLTDKALPEGGTATGRIDWTHRFDNMQQHSGEHIFSGLLCGKYSCDNVGFHLSDQTVTMDYNRACTAQEIAAIEQEVNEVIWKNLPIEISFPTGAELEKLTYRSKKELSGRIRIVTIPGVDVCACCAPHVRHTGEIGLLKVLSVQNYKGGIRVTIACGKRAFDHLSGQSDTLSGMAKELSTAPEEVPGQLARLRRELTDCRRRMAVYCESVLLNRLRTEPAISFRDERAAVLFDAEADAQAARRAVNARLEEQDGLVLVFLGDDETGYQYLIGAGGDHADARIPAKLLGEKLGGRGGGSREMTQGRVDAARELILETLKHVD